MVPPLEFIAILEDTGLIVPVGEWVLRTVCRQLAAWKAQGLVPRPVAINLSARQFQERGLDEVVRAIVAEEGGDPALLEFELTESMLMADADAATRTLASLKAYGVRLSVDDFGTGYSSLSYLKRFPLDALKIDRSFMRDVTTDSNDASIALAIIRLAHSLRLDVVAEGSRRPTSCSSCGRTTATRCRASSSRGRWPWRIARRRCGKGGGWQVNPADRKAIGHPGERRDPPPPRRASQRWTPMSIGVTVAWRDGISFEGGSASR